MPRQLFGKNEDEWISRYASSHTNKVNRACHTVGIPMIVISLLFVIPALFVNSLWLPAISLFVLGWVLQFVGHMFERKWPEFFYDWRFLFVGLRWWLAKIQGKA